MYAYKTNENTVEPSNPLPTGPRVWLELKKGRMIKGAHLFTLKYDALRLVHTSSN